MDTLLKEFACFDHVFLTQIINQESLYKKSPI